MRRPRRLQVNWKSLVGAAHGKRTLKLRPNQRDLYTCPIKLCLHGDFKSCRGLRKHINTKHPWYYYFDEQPEVKREDMTDFPVAPKRASTAGKPSFSLDEGIGRDFLTWLGTSCGGGKSNKEARQIGKRAMKYFMHAMGNNENDIDLTNEFVDCCLSSASIFISFLKVIEEEWKVGPSGAVNYVKCITDFIDFRKANGVSDNTLRCFTVVEVYLRRANENLRKKKNLDCNRNLDLETLIARNSWATLEEMEVVIPFHMKQFKKIIEKCSESHEARFLTKGELVFCIRFITTLLFLRVKCSRPMTYQFLTVEMVNKARNNGGFVDQREFKTASRYIFDTLILSDDTIEIIDLYLEYIRPRLNPQCDFLLLSTNGTQFQSLTSAMTILVHEAIGKHINPTRYRQIVETESSERLNLEEQHYITEDQKHSSTVAKIHYKKTQSRIVAVEGRKCMEKMTKDARSDGNKNLVEMFNNISCSFDNDVLSHSRRIIEGMKPNAQNSISSASCSSSHMEVDTDPYQPVSESLNESTDMVITETFPTNNTPAVADVQEVSILNIPNDNIVIKKEAARQQTNRKQPKNVKFTSAEDHCLKQGIEKYGRKSWAIILKDPNLKFHETRSRDSLRVRADSACFRKLFNDNK
ncbi:uncharacterized protein [Clytia hemisphaerica]|uniref:uncharacterized protein n=2 Tax=Clytia hemisphaerica TaxID=252671 RepID=UPI0034D716BC